MSARENNPALQPVRRSSQQAVRHARSGFTFVELCIGMVVTGLVLSALAAFSLATAEAWKSGITSNPVGGGQTIASIPVMGTLAGARLDAEIRACAATGGYYAGTLTSSTGQQASLMLWKADVGSPADGKVDATECELLEYDATDHVIYKWTTTTSSLPDYTTQFSSASWISTFKSSATRQVFVRNIDGMQIYVHTPTSRYSFPLVEYRLYFSRGGHVQTRYGAVSLRSPTTPYGLTLN